MLFRSDQGAKNGGFHARSKRSLIQKTLVDPLLDLFSRRSGSRHIVLDLAALAQIELEFVKIAKELDTVLLSFWQACYRIVNPKAFKKHVFEIPILLAFEFYCQYDSRF